MSYQTDAAVIAKELTLALVEKAPLNTCIPFNDEAQYGNQYAGFVNAAYNSIFDNVLKKLQSK